MTIGLAETAIAPARIAGHFPATRQVAQASRPAAAQDSPRDHSSQRVLWKGRDRVAKPKKKVDAYEAIPIWAELGPPRSMSWVSSGIEATSLLRNVARRSRPRLKRKRRR